MATIAWEESIFGFQVLDSAEKMTNRPLLISDAVSRHR